MQKKLQNKFNEKNIIVKIMVQNNGKTLSLKSRKVALKWDLLYSKKDI